MSDNIQIAIRICGGFGTAVVRINYVYKFYQYLNGDKVELFIYGHRNEEMNDALFAGQSFIKEYYNEDEFKNICKEKFDLIFEVDVLPKIYHIKWDKIQSNTRLCDLLKHWEDIFNDPYYEFYYKENIRWSKPYVFRKLISEGYNCLNSADIDRILGVGNDYTIPMVCFNDMDATLEKFGLNNKRFITVQRGGNNKLNSTELVKMWPFEKYCELIEMLHKEYPDIVIVQLGESLEHCRTIDGVDINLLGKTSWEDLKILLSKAVLHIDGECGMVHLRKALRGGPSVVIFGQTPVDYFGYEGNINISSNVCADWCLELIDGWEYRCPKRITPAPCINSISSEIVFDKIQNFFNNDKSVLFTHDKYIENNAVYRLIDEYGDCLDEEFIDNWLSKEYIYDYEVIDIKIRELVCTIFNGKDWEIIPICNHPAFDYLKGNKYPYTKNIMLREKNNIYSHSVERFENVIDNIRNNNINIEATGIVIASNNLIKDGIHRACLLMHLYGDDVKAKVIRVYKYENDL